MKQERVRTLNKKEIGVGPVVYWMDRDMRVQDNWALVHAQAIAIARKVPLLVMYNLVTQFLGGGARQVSFKLEALQEMQKDLQKKNIPFFVLIDDEGKQSARDVVEFCKEHKIGTVVTDFSPLRIQRTWKEYVAKHVTCAVYEVDTHNIIPAWITSPKQEYAAYTIRPKIYRLIAEYLDEIPAFAKQVIVYDKKVPVIDWNTLRQKNTDIKSTPVDWCHAGEEAAHITLAHFLRSRLGMYAHDRNDANKDGQSNLSPYLHYGMISAQRVVLDVVKYVGMPIQEIIDAQKNKAKIEDGKELTIMDHAGAFLEELIVRRELSDNFCLYNQEYDSFDGFPDWARKTLEQHRGDTREHTYSQSQFEQANTHDDLWNACQQEMVATGKMHGYMRMYWAKKILEWSKSPEDAMKIAVYLNDTYELDGRDPNGYAGIAWSIGGVHDRAWFTRPIFGMVRFMARSGCEKKFDVKKYITKWDKKILQQSSLISHE